MPQTEEMEDSYRYREEEWMDEAACRGYPTDLFFPEKGVNPAPALAVCQTCDVRNPCLEYSFRFHIRDGVWGGMTIRPRRMAYHDRLAEGRATGGAA